MGRPRWRNRHTTCTRLREICASAFDSFVLTKEKAMFDHMMFHVADLKKSQKFYEAALASQHMHLAFKAHSQKEVDEFFKAAFHGH
jgi:hypothetical protein